jgi:hypothetical protein
MRGKRERLKNGVPQRRHPWLLFSGLLDYCFFGCEFGAEAGGLLAGVELD